MVLRLIAHLYESEKRWDQQGITCPKLRAVRRQSEQTPTLQPLEKVVHHLRRRSLPQSNPGKACAYFLGQWKALRAHLRHGQTRIDNNLVENAIRPSALGKKNWLFIGHPEAGQRSAIIYSIIVSCQRHRIDPWTYLTDVLSRLPEMSNQDDLRPLLPSNWQRA